MKALKLLGKILLATALIAGVLLFCLVKFVDSRYLAQATERIVNDYIDGELQIGSMKLGFNPGFPILSVEIEDLTLISHALDSLSPEQRGFLPAYSDSLLSLGYLKGAIDIKRLIADNELSLHDVVLNGLSVNMVIARNGKGNYEIVSMQPDSASSSKRNMPAIRIDRFALSHPREMRFFNAADSTSASVLLLTDASVEQDAEPAYRLKINGNVTSSKATLMTNLERITFGANGKVYWDPSKPGLVAMDEMKIQGAFLKAAISGEIDLTESPIIRKGSVRLEPVAVTDIISLLPDSLRQEHRLYEPYFSTDAVITGKFELTSPMNLATDTIPSAGIRISIPPSFLNYDHARFEKVAFDANVTTFTNLPDSTVIDITRCFAGGKATRLNVNGRLSSLLSDPAFDATVQGSVDLKDLPQAVRGKIPGYLAGILTADLHARGRASMLGEKHFHNLKAEGNVMARDVYFLSADTNNMAEVRKAKVAFGASDSGIGIPCLTARVDVDTATILTGGVGIAVGALDLALGSERGGNKADTALNVPYGGNLKVGRLNVISITDSAGGRMSGISGHVSLKRFNDSRHMPVILTDLLTGHVSAGTLSDRVVIDDTRIKASLRKRTTENGRQKTEDVKRKTKTGKHRVISYISPDKVFHYVYEKRRHKPGQKRKRRVYGALGADNNELLEWDLASGFRKFLTGWQLHGSVTSHKGQLLTPLLPLRNRISLIDLTFSNDTVNLRNISMIAGKSDMAISGLITNVERALTSKTHDTLKANLAIMSDTIDINQISAAILTGASYANERREGKTRFAATDDAALERRIDVLAKKGPGKAAPILIPVNIDASLKIDARCLLYSDLRMDKTRCDVLVYDGGVNIHDLISESDAGRISVSALYSAPNPDRLHVGFGMELKDFNIAKFVRIVPALDSIVPLMHDFSGMVSADIAATCSIDSAMNLILPSLDAAVRVTGDNLAFIDPKKYRTLGKWLGFKDKTDNTIKRMNVELTVADGMMRVYPFAFNIDRYRLGISGYNDITMNFNYHISVLKSPLPFRFGINISGHPGKYKVRFGGAKFKEDNAAESVSVVNAARINLIDQIENVFRRGVRNSRFAKLQIAHPAGLDSSADPGLSATDSLRLIQEGLLLDQDSI